MSKVSNVPKAPKATKRPAVVMPGVAEDRAITAAAKADPEAQPLTPQQLAAMAPLRDYVKRQSRRA